MTAKPHSLVDERWMALALRHGARGLGQVWPNPAVGCVIVKDARVVGRGRTARGGRPHAETEALAMAGKDGARDATAYVSLEPCAHNGKTPPCADALIASGVARVVTAMEDPDPRTRGQGHARLRAAGIEVVEGVLRERAEEAQQGFLLRHASGRPMVTLKLATGFDGRIATASGESRWITGPEARRRVHGMRAAHDMVLVGGGTIRADDPDLSVREFGQVAQPVRGLVSRRLSLGGAGRLIGSANNGPVWAVVERDAVPSDAADAWELAGGRLLNAAPGPGGGLDPGDVLAVLAREGITRVFCEGGGALAASLLSAGLVDRVVGFTAGLILGAEGRPSIGALGLGRLADAPRFTLRGVERVGADLMHVWSRD